MKYLPKRDIISIAVPQGKRNAYKLAAAELGLSLSILFQHAVEEYIQNHADEELQKNFSRLIQEIKERAAQKKIV